MLLVIGGNFALGLTIKTAQNTKTASVNSPWTCIWDGLLSEGYLHLRFGGGLFSGGLIFAKAYDRNFTVIQHWELNFNMTSHCVSDFKKGSKRSTCFTHPRSFDTRLGDWASVNLYSALHLNLFQHLFHH